MPLDRLFPTLRKTSTQCINNVYIQNSLRLCLLHIAQVLFRRRRHLLLDRLLQLVEIQPLGGNMRNNERIHFKGWTKRTPRYIINLNLLMNRDSG